MSLVAVILAAGLGKRMRSPLPKVLHRAAGRPLVRWVAAAAADAGADALIAVVGPEMSAADRVEHLAGFTLVTQHDRLGTGHATGIALAALPAAATEVLVLCGDVPCLRAATLRLLVAHRRAAGSAAAVLTMILDDPFGYGRIVRRGGDGPVAAIVEERDAASGIKAIREVNSGTYIFRREILEAGIKALKPDNAQGEYYLTDVVRFAVDKGETVIGVVADDPRELLGVNTPEQLAEVGRILAARPGPD